MFDFPNSPTVGQVVTGGNGAAYQWDGVKWDASSAITGAAANNVGRNLLHNSMFNINQRGGPWTGGGYTSDRWMINYNTDTMSGVNVAALNDAQRTAIGDDAANLSYVVTFTGNAAATAFTVVQQRMENTRRFGGKTVTVSFWAWCGSGALKLGVSFDQTFGSGGSPSVAVLSNGQSVTLNVTPTRYSVTLTIPSTIGKVFGTTNGTDFSVLNLWCSSSTDNALRAGNIGVQSGAIGLWGVQLEIGNVMTPLEKPDPQVDLANCQRFYQIGNTCFYGYSEAGMGFGGYQSYPVTFRAAPTVVFSGVQYANSSGIGLNGGNYGANYYATCTATGSANFFASFTASADL